MGIAESLDAGSRLRFRSPDYLIGNYQCIGDCGFEITGERGTLVPWLRISDWGFEIIGERPA